jgi:D-alanyl-D-alanine carboxypeptidase
MLFPTVRFHDVAMRTLMIRVPRDFYAIMRSTMTMTTVLGGRRVILVVLKVNGGARTAKRTAIQYTERFYRDRIQIISKHGQRKQQSKGDKDEQRKVDRLCQRLEETIATIHDIE